MRTSILALTAASSLLRAPDTEGAGGKPKPDPAGIEVVDGKNQSAASIDTQTGNVEQSGHDGHVEVGGGAELPGSVAADEPGKEKTAEELEAEASRDIGDEQATEVPRVEGDLVLEGEGANLEAFDAHFKRENGTLNMGALSQQWWDNYAKNDGNGHLDDNTYAYLEQLGISKEDAQTFEAAQVALNEKNTGSLYDHVGGQQDFEAMVNWGRGDEKAGVAPGYSKQQREAFNRALAQGGQLALDAVELLKQRFDAAGKSNLSPSTTTTNTRTGGENHLGGDDTSQGVYGSREEWVQARKDAGNDMNKQALVSAKFRRSPGAARW